MKRVGPAVLAVVVARDPAWDAAAEKARYLVEGASWRSDCPLMDSGGDLVPCRPGCVRKDWAREYAGE